MQPLLGTVSVGGDISFICEVEMIVSDATASF